MNDIAERFALEMTRKDQEIKRLNARLSDAEAELEAHKKRTESIDVAGWVVEIDKLKASNAAKDGVIEDQAQRIAELANRE